MRIILGSRSPRRLELLKLMGIPALVFPAALDEVELSKGIPARKLSRHLCIHKMEAVKQTWIESHGPTDDLFLTADTVVELGKRSLGEAGSAEEAAAILKQLSGRTHRVRSALALSPGSGGGTLVREAVTKVRFRPLSDAEIAAYVQSGEWHGVAGAYRIQERGETLIQWIKGSWSTVVGLPIPLLYGMLASINIPLRGISSVCSITDENK